MNSLQPAQNSNGDNQASNGFSSTSFMNQFVHRQTVKKVSTGPAVTVSDKLKSLQHELLTSISLLTPTRLRPLQLRKQLQNYQYEKERKNQSDSLQRFGKGQQQLFKQQQNLILILTSVMREFRSSKQKYFYILTKKSSRVLYFQHRINGKDQNIQSVLTICSMYQKIAPELDLNKIPYQTVPTQSGEKILIKNQAIAIFWGKLMNSIIESQKQYRSFYILANYTFPGGSEVLATQLFNGLESNKQYRYLSKPSTNILGEQIQEVYRMKIAGIWTVHNLKNVADKLTEMFGQKYFDIEYEIDRVTQFLREQGEQNSSINKKLF